MAHIKHLTIVMQLLGAVAALFYHEASFATIKPAEKPLNKMANFGFSIAYQNADGNQSKLIVGSPHATMEGRVYNCPVSKDKTVLCNRFNINVKELAPDYDVKYPEQPFCLGTAVAATESYFITCAPLWTTTGVKQCTSCEDNSGSHGTCFVYYGPHRVKRFNGLVEQFKNGRNIKNDNLILGGMGLSLLADPKNDVILIGKPAVYGDILYLDSTRPLDPAQSLLLNDKTKESAEQFRTNIGYATASGKFFSGANNNNNTEYAFSFQDKHVKGKVGFLHYNSDEKLLKLSNATNPLTISGTVPGSMFGATLHGADVNADGMTDLLLGAPAYNLAERHPESGALYIYLGGDENIDDRKRTILGAKPGSRFGTVIATADIDGDALPEIFVSAPFEDSEIGVVYILSGYEMNRTVISLKTSYDEVALLDLQLTQKIQMKDFRWFGFSLQVVPDVDDNGCDELAVGSPRSNKVLLFRCVPAVTASISARSLKEVIILSDQEFQVEVCVNVSYHVKPKHVSTVFTVLSEVRGKEVTIPHPRFYVSQKNPSHCQNITVKFTAKDEGEYYFSAKILSNDNTLIETKEFDPTWVRLSPYSKLEHSFRVTRNCSDTDCSPRLSMELLWANRSAVKELIVDSNLSENVTVLVTNHGASAYEACLRVRITGVQVLSIPCGVYDVEMYKCDLPRPLGKDKQYRLDILVGINKASTDDKLHVDAFLYNNCNSPNATKGALDVNFMFINKNVYVSGISHNLNITDTQIMDSMHPILEDRQEYLIINNGSLSWPNVNAFVNVTTKKIIQNFMVLTVENGNCSFYYQLNDSKVFICNGSLPAYKTLRVIILYEILRNKIRENLVGDKIEIESQITVRMRALREHDSKNIVKGRQITTILYIKELSLGNNKGLIIFLAIFAAILILGALGCVLYKIGFFKRKEKERLDSLKASFRSNENPFKSGEGSKELEQSPKRNHSMDDDFDIEVIEDYQFEAVPLSDDEAALITTIKKSKDDKRESPEDPDNKLEMKNDTTQTKSTADNAPLIVEEVKKDDLDHTKL